MHADHLLGTDLTLSNFFGAKAIRMHHFAPKIARPPARNSRARSKLMTSTNGASLLRAKLTAEISHTAGYRGMGL
jgi:hypothetical protein